MNKIEKAFRNIEAEEALKEETFKYIMNFEKKKKSKMFRKFSLAAVALIFIILGTGYYTYGKAVTYISIDVNPSIELEVNRFNKVIGVKGYNDEGEKIISDINVNNRYYMEAVDAIMGSSEMEKYVSKGDEFLFTVVSENGEEIVKKIESSKEYKKLKIECTIANNSMVKKAHNKNMSIGRYCHYVDAKEAGSDITLEETRRMSIKELNKLRENGVEHKNNMKKRGHHN